MTVGVFGAESIGTARSCAVLVGFKKAGSAWKRLRRSGKRLQVDYLPASIPRSSTSKMRVEFGPMAPPAPCSP